MFDNINRKLMDSSFLEQAITVAKDIELEQEPALESNDDTTTTTEKDNTTVAAAPKPALAQSTV